ncbi:hypothetical protein PRIPAC_75701, partial [Pristionchus pacificus]
MRNIKNSSYHIVMEEINPIFANIDIETNAHVNFYESIPPDALNSLKGKKGEHYRIYRTREEIPLRYHY